MRVRPLLVAALLLVALPSPAGAHTDLTAAEPAPGATVDASPAEVVLRFSDEVVPAADGVTVVGTDGERADTGEVTKPDDTTIVLALRPNLPPGRYAVEWRILAPDGDVQEGGHEFTVAGEPTSSTTEAPTTTTTEGSTSVRVADPPDREESVDATSALLILGGMAILVALLVAVLVRRRRGDRP